MTSADARKKAKAARDRSATASTDRFEAGEAQSIGCQDFAATSFEAVFATEYIASHRPLAQRDAPEAVDLDAQELCLPRHRQMNVADIDSPDVLRVLKPIWRTKSETAIAAPAH